MRRRYVWRDGAWQERVKPASTKAPSKGPFLMPDIEPYKSPLSRPDAPHYITSRAERREELRRHDLREVDPSEAPESIKPILEKIEWDRSRERN